MVADRSLLYLSEVDPVCDEISVRVEFSRGIRSAAILFVLHHCQIIDEEFSETPCAEAALQPSVLWAKKMIRLYITREARD